MHNILIQDLAIERWAIEALIRSARNARTHSSTQIAQLAASIKRFGFNNPILVTPEGRIIAGHGRVLAALKLGITHVPVIVLRHLTTEQESAFRLADNQIALNAGWNFEILRLELEELAKLDVNLDELGFSEKQLQEVLGREIALPGSDPDSVPDPHAGLVSRPGDLWELGQHRLLCGDATQQETLAHVLAGRACSLVFSDFPYNANYVGKDPAKMTIANDNLGPEFGAFLRSACDAILSVAQGAVYICMSSSQLHELYKAFVDAGGHFSTFIVWAKTNFTLGRADYQRQHEWILYGWPRGKSRYWCGARDQGDVWLIGKPSRNNLHPTSKPTELIERAISNSSRSGDVVLDPFSGSGSTMIACENIGRKACLVEIDPIYVDRSVRRWERYTNRRAHLAATGKSFDEVAGERLGQSVAMETRGEEAARASVSTRKQIGPGPPSREP